MDRIGRERRITVLERSRCLVARVEEALGEKGSCIKTDRKRYRCGKRCIAGARATASLILEEGDEQKRVCLHVRGSAHLCAFRFCLRVRIYSGEDWSKESEGGGKGMKAER